MTVAHPGDREADADHEPLLHDPDSYSLSSFDDLNEHDDVEPLPPVRTKGKQKVQHRINAVLPEIQKYPLNVFQRLIPSSIARIAILALAHGIWVVYMVLLSVRASNLPDVPGYGQPHRLTCYSNAFGNIVERSAVPSCDTTGPECINFIPPPFAFRCPPDCASAHLQEEHYLGDEYHDHKIWVIGGGSANDTGEKAAYRADSYICGAALHAGVISDKNGGCGILTLEREHESYQGSTANGIEGLTFDASFPLSFTIAKAEEPSSRCYDIIWTPFIISVLITVAISLLTTSPSVFFFSIFTIVFFQTALLTDPPNFEEYTHVVQVAFGRFLPASFVAFAIYQFAAKQTLTDLDAYIEKTILWVGGCWLGSVDNYTLDRLPLSRLTPRDLREPGAIIVLLCVIGAIIAAAGTQAYAFWRDGRFWKYLSLYGIMGFTIVILVFVPGLNLRIHHYILALLLLPGTAIQTRPGLLFQGFLLGLFINGIARWGFASILETTTFLAREGQLGSQIPHFLGPVITPQTSTIAFEFPDLSMDWDGISVMVNDVERMRLPRHGNGMQTVFEWTKARAEDLYFRFAYVREGYVEVPLVGDYSRPSRWKKDGTWSVLPERPT